ncbi:hypothetical protein ACFL9T_22530 [Thermodesulfobacteriota bacterium]
MSNTPQVEAIDGNPAGGGTDDAWMVDQCWIRDLLSVITFANFKVINPANALRFYLLSLWEKR